LEAPPPEVMTRKANQSALVVPGRRLVIKTGVFGNRRRDQ
jgi:hypothetical protein